MDTPEIPPTPPCSHPGEKLLFREVNTWSGGPGYNIVCICGHTFSTEDGHHVERMMQVWRNMKMMGGQAAA